MSNKQWCPHCGAKDRLVKNGTQFDYRTGNTAQRYLCNECDRNTQSPLDVDPKINIFDEIRRPLPITNKYVITCAQNATNPHTKFLHSLHQYCRENSAELLIIPIRYKNPTSTWSKNAKSHDWWHESFAKHLFVDRVDLNPNLQLLGDIRTQLTAEKPLTGFETITGAMSGILAHPKLQLLTIATPAHTLPKLMTTTGAVTLDDNYIDSKAGKKGQFHHTYGAIVVEQDKGTFHLRQINATKNGSFIDLDKKYTPKGVEDAPPAKALVMGDVHTQFVDPGVVKATFTGKKSIMQVLKPEQLIYHDVLDFYSQNWHDSKNPFIRFGKHKAKMDGVYDELVLTCDFINKYTPEGCKAIIVASNHNEGLERWIRDHDWKHDPSHMEFYLETALEMIRGTKMTEAGVDTIDPFKYWAEKMLKVDYQFLDRDEPHEVMDIECGFHGDEGVNGAKGSAETFKRIGAKTIIAHFHRPEIAEGCYQVGTNSRLKVQYTSGPSSWLHTDCVIYANGKRSLINIIGGEWRL